MIIQILSLSGDGVVDLHEQTFNFRSTSDERTVPEVVVIVLNQFNERDEQAPRVWSLRDQSLEQDARDLLLHNFELSLGEQEEQQATKVVRVVVGVAQLIGNGAEQPVAALGVELCGKSAEY